MSRRSSTTSPTEKQMHKIFPMLPPDEPLIADHMCAYQSTILLQGKLYLTPNYLLFHANIFGYKTSILIPLSEITSVERAKTVGVIPNAIRVKEVGGGEFFFTSFVTREAAFGGLCFLWRRVKDQEERKLRSRRRGGRARGRSSAGRMEDGELSASTVERRRRALSREHHQHPHKPLHKVQNRELQPSSSTTPPSVVAPSTTNLLAPPPHHLPRGAPLLLQTTPPTSDSDNLKPSKPSKLSSRNSFVLISTPPLNATTGQLLTESEILFSTLQSKSERFLKSLFGLTPKTADFWTLLLFLCCMVCLAVVLGSSLAVWRLSESLRDFESLAGEVLLDGSKRSLMVMGGEVLDAL
ncbi:hypothetical protein HDV05_002864 [Chytridiales sp. JEL 0842]|nr:hypothetical protein HDV05_002864 [Chytridiales sp. JEL 0842]